MVALRPVVGTAIAAALLAGCSGGNGAGIQSNWTQYAQLMREGFGGRNSGKITLTQAAEVPYASLAYRVNSGRQAMLVLATDSNNDQIWTAASHVVLMTRDGRVMRSIGLPHDRGATTPQGTQALPAPGLALKGAYRSQRVMDFPDIGAYAVPIACTTTPRRREVVTILGTALNTMRVDETCQSRNPLWSFTDSYWLDPQSGFVWRSEQTIHPSGTRVQIEILRPPE